MNHFMISFSNGEQPKDDFYGSAYSNADPRSRVKGLSLAIYHPPRIVMFSQ